MSRRFAVDTLPRREACVEARLRRRGYRAWLPSIERLRRHARRIDTVFAPWFPGYLLAQLDIEREGSASIDATPDVRRLPGHRDRPMLMVTGFIEALRQISDSDGVGTLPRLAANGRAAPLPGLMGQEVSTGASRRMLAPAG